VDYVQFMKSGDTGEAVSLGKLPNISYYCPGEHPFIMSKGPDRIHYEHAEKALAYALKAVDRGTQVLVCDEILDTLLFKLLEEDQLMDLMQKCRKRAELVMTGRTAPRDFLHMADYVAELIQVKHPYYTGAIARRGIEY
jgi:cob(I)alamin adenosyltransferase